MSTTGIEKEPANESIASQSRAVAAVHFQRRRVWSVECYEPGVQLHRQGRGVVQWQVLQDAAGWRMQVLGRCLEVQFVTTVRYVPGRHDEAGNGERVAAS